MKFRKYAATTTSMIMPVTRTVPRRERWNMRRFTSPPGSAIASAIATPTAADSVGVAQPA